jgi:hypothetical protein
MSKLRLSVALTKVQLVTLLTFAMAKAAAIAWRAAVVAMVHAMAAATVLAAVDAEEEFSDWVYSAAIAASVSLGN